MSRIAVAKVEDLGMAAASLLEEMHKTLHEVEQRAYHLFQQRGGAHGLDLDDWLRAEKDVTWAPRSELIDSDKELILRIATPGFEPKDIQVTVTPQSVIIQGKSTHEHTEADGGLHFCEFQTKLFRRYELPARIDIDKAWAVLEKGILQVVAPKAADRGRKRSVTVSG